MPISFVFRRPTFGVARPLPGHGGAAHGDLVDESDMEPGRRVETGERRRQAGQPDDHVPAGGGTGNGELVVARDVGRGSDLREGGEGRRRNGAGVADVDGRVRAALRAEEYFDL